MESSLGHGRGNDTHEKWGTPSTNIFYRDVLKCFAVAELCFSSRKRPHLRPEVPARVCGDRQALAELLPAPAPAAPTAPVAPAAPGACHVTIEGVDLAQSALEDFASSYFMWPGRGVRAKNGLGICALGEKQLFSPPVVQGIFWKSLSIQTVFWRDGGFSCPETNVRGKVQEPCFSNVTPTVCT